MAITVQVSRDVREYLPFTTKTGSVIEALLLGESGEAAVIAYPGEVVVVRAIRVG
ncbi:hypothetical protein SBA6_60073 [Candidatus Sulfopaludibacter sp. SbA6]|nr:hypothetical protein SBA6_60073 [Candidatus Sulfopaludibacter sp. SbA6]